MAGSEKVQEYLQKHKIGHLFEDLMAKVISEMPDDPLFYLIQTLERKATRMGSKAHMRRSMGDLGRIRSPSPEKSATWAGGLAVAKDRQYEKPWQTNTKRQKNKKPLESESGPRKAKSLAERPEWDNKVKTTAISFDDFWEDGEMAGTKGRRRSTSPARQVAGGTAAWTESQDDEELLYQSFGYEGPRRLVGQDSDPLAGEFSLVKEEKATPKKTGSISHGHVRGPRADAERHRHQLAQLISSKRHQVDSGVEEDLDLDEDDALELLEDADELIAEGVKNVKRSGIRLKHTPSPGDVKPAVRVSICARCAKVMNGGNPSESSPGTGYGQLPDFNYDTDRDESRPQSAARASPGLTDDEFESVSQVTGPRRPVWQDDNSDEEVPSGQRGRHMFTSSGIPNKGRPMFKPESDSSPNVRASGPVVQHSVNTASKSSAFKGHTSFNKTWTPGVGQDSDEEVHTTYGYHTSYIYVSASYDAQFYQAGPDKEVSFNTGDVATDAGDNAKSTARTLKDTDDDDGTSDALSLRGAGWAPAPATDYDSDFSLPPRQVQQKKGKIRNYQGQY